jgi:hypothetical protein
MYDIKTKDISLTKGTGCRMVQQPIPGKVSIFLLTTMFIPGLGPINPSNQ